MLKVDAYKPHGTFDVGFAYSGKRKSLLIACGLWYIRLVWK